MTWRKDGDPVPNFSESDWQEIYYALLDKANGIATGRYGEKNSDGVCDTKWIRQLRRIAAEIAKEHKV